MQSQKVAIIGNGRYGKLLSNFLLARGCEVKVSDIETTPSTSEIVSWSDVIVVAVTLLETIKVIESISKQLRSDQLIIDVTSTKAEPVLAMLASKAEVVGVHPFTAPPKSGTFRGQTIFVHYARVSKWKAWVNEFLLATEATIDDVDPDTHDLERTVDQGLDHMCTLLKVLVMMRLGLDPRRLFKVASPVYKMSFAQMARMFAQDHRLYGGLPMANSHMARTLELFREEFDRYVRIVVEKDMKAYGTEFDAGKTYLGDASITEAFALSEELIRTMVEVGKQA